MNVRFMYGVTSYNTPILKDATCQYLYNLVHNTYRIPLDLLVLKYKKEEIPNNSKLFIMMLTSEEQEDLEKEITIFICTKDQNSQNKKRHRKAESYNYIKTSFPKLHETSKILNTLNIEQAKEKAEENIIKQGYRKRIAMKCQICHLKNSIFYCRDCNQFICLECNVRYLEHKSHERINLEDGDSFLGYDVYREELLKLMSILEKGYKKTEKMKVQEDDKNKYLDKLFSYLEKIKKDSNTLATKNSIYQINEDIIEGFNSDVKSFVEPRHKEEIIECFNKLFYKEKEINNYIKYINLEIIKCKYDNILMKVMDVINKNMEILINEINSKLIEVDDVRYKTISDVKLFLKEKSQIDLNEDKNNNISTSNIFENNTNNNTLECKSSKNINNHEITNSIIDLKKSYNNNIIKQAEKKGCTKLKLKEKINKNKTENKINSEKTSVDKSNYQENINNNKENCTISEYPTIRQNLTKPKSLTNKIFDKDRSLKESYIKYSLVNEDDELSSCERGNKNNMQVKFSLPLTSRNEEKIVIKIDSKEKNKKTHIEDIIEEENKIKNKEKEINLDFLNPILSQPISNFLVENSKKKKIGKNYSKHLIGKINKYYLPRLSVLGGQGLSVSDMKNYNK